MNQSAIEREVAIALDTLAARLRQHDRGVLIGALLCLIPVLPIPLVGLAMCAGNWFLLVRGSLPVRERRLILASVVLGVMMSGLGAVVASLLIHSVFYHALEAWRWIRSSLPPMHYNPDTRSAWHAAPVDVWIAG